MSQDVDSASAARRRWLRRLTLAAAATTATPAAVVAIGQLNADAATRRTAKSTKTIASTQKISGTFNSRLIRYKTCGEMGYGDRSESQGAIFELADGATVKNVISGTPRPTVGISREVALRRKFGGRTSARTRRRSTAEARPSTQSTVAAPSPRRTRCSSTTAAAR